MNKHQCPYYYTQYVIDTIWFKEFKCKFFNEVYTLLFVSLSTV